MLNNRLNPSKNNSEKIVRGLWAAGEAACSSVHGANRLGANSLLDIVVFGKACAHHISNNFNDNNVNDVCDDDAMIDDIKSILEIKNNKGEESVADLRLEMQKIMQSNAGVFRTEKLMKEGVVKLNNLKKN